MRLVQNYHYGLETHHLMTDIVKTVTVGDATIPIFNGRIGISVSGGADSAVLLYILMTELEPDQELHIYSFGKLPTHYSAISGARLIAQRCCELTGFTNYQHHTDYGDVQNRQMLFRNVSADLSANIIDIHYTGITANPPLEIADGFLGATENTQQDMRDPGVKRDIMMNERICMPLTNLNKQQVADMYRELDLIDSLYSYTRSCESYDPSHLGTHCGNCWWCKERVWGFGKL